MVLEICVVALVLIIVYAYFNSRNAAKISRTKVIQASPEKIFPYINNSRLIQEWNPFMDGDPDVKMTYAGPAEGIGAQWEWQGTKAGAGKATITEVEPNKRVVLRLAFEKPFKATNYGEYSLKAQGSGIEVTWLINESALVPRVINAFVSLDKIVGNHFERGLAKLQTLLEARQ